MYLSLMVPLDRSSFAEQALPLATGIARRAKARLDLVEVHTLYAFTDRAAGWCPYDPAEDAACKREEQLYLDATAKWATSVSSVSVTTTVLSGTTVSPETVADSLLEKAREAKTDLIVTTTHGRGSLNRLGLGSVADELIRRAAVPVVLVRAEDKAVALIPEPVLDNVLIPLDGSVLAEGVLEPALELARLMEARCTLLQVIEADPSPAGHGAGGPSDRARADAEAYLERVGGRARAQGLRVRTRVVVARSAAKAILETALAEASNLIAVATRGRGGFERLLLGSIADQLVRSAPSPVLVYRPTEKG
jgi:nucleotide-binding universal stress UspA family protein